MRPVLVAAQDVLRHVGRHTVPCHGSCNITQRAAEHRAMFRVQTLHEVWTADRQTVDKRYANRLPFDFQTCPARA